MAKPFNERRLYRSKRWAYLLDDDDKTAWIVKGHIGRCRRYRVPESIDVDGQRYTITSIEIDAFNRPRTLRHLTIPDSIEYVDEDVFTFMPKLRSIHIGTGVRHLTNWHFRRMESLIPLFINHLNQCDSPVRISCDLLLTGDGLTVMRTMKYRRHYVIPEGVDTIFACAMWENPILEEVTLPSTLKVVGDNGLSHNPRLKRLVFPEGFETFDVQGLMNDTGLEYLDLPSTLLQLTDSLYGCTSLQTLIIRTPRVFDQSHLYLDDIPHSCRILVPSPLVESYKMHPLWKNFTIESVPAEDQEN